MIDAGATTINLPDTVGYSHARRDRRVLHGDHRRRCRAASKAIFSTHCHDDLGLAVANSLAAIRAGARQVECTINGIGERAGNASLEEIVMVSHVRARSRAVHDRHRHPRDLSRRSQLLTEADRRGRAGQQGDRRPQRVRARSRHPPGRHAEGSPHLRDHERPRTSASRRRRWCSASTRAGTPSQKRCEDARPRAVASSSSIGSIAR